MTAPATARKGAVSAARGAVGDTARRSALRNVAGFAKRRAANPLAYTGRNIGQGFRHLVSPQSMIANAGMMGGFMALDSMTGGGGPELTGEDADIMKALASLEGDGTSSRPSDLYRIR